MICNLNYGASKKIKQGFSLLRMLCISLTMLLLMNTLPIQSYAVWDGKGDSSGSSNATQTTGDFWVPNGSADDIVGYRFSCYDSEGNKIGDSIDI